MSRSSSSGKKKYNLKKYKYCSIFFNREQLFVNFTVLDVPVMYMFLIKDGFSSSKTFVIFFTRFRI